jgi:hypothetical protein
VALRPRGPGVIFANFCLSGAQFGEPAAVWFAVAHLHPIPLLVQLKSSSPRRPEQPGDEAKRRTDSQ